MCELNLNASDIICSKMYMEWCCEIRGEHVQHSSESIKVPRLTCRCFTYKTDLISDQDTTLTCCTIGKHNHMKRKPALWPKTVLGFDASLPIGFCDSNVVLPLRYSLTIPRRYERYDMIRGTIIDDKVVLTHLNIYFMLPILPTIPQSALDYFLVLGFLFLVDCSAFAAAFRFLLRISSRKHWLVLLRSSFFSSTRFSDTR